MKSLQGQFLIASSKLMDRNFYRTVVLMVQHNEEGALGLIINRPLDMTIKTAWEQVSEGSCEIEQPIYQGGPCEGPLMVIHTSMPESEKEIIPGVYFTTERDQIEQLVSANEGEMKFFVGYAGWAAGQLEAEMEVGGWHLAPATASEIFSGESENLWISLQKAIAQSLFDSINPKTIPEDPSMN